MLDAARLGLVTPETAGAPLGARPWGRRRQRRPSQRLAHAGHPTRAPPVSRWLHKHEYALRVNAQENAAGSAPPDRDTPFQSRAAPQEALATAGGAIIRVDTTKQAWLGDFKHAGPGWCQQAIAVNGHDFPSAALGRAVPYGIYDPQRNEGAVSVGASADTSEFAVTAMARWWEDRGGVASPQATHLLILADAGGHHGCQPRVWNAPQQSHLSDRFGWTVPVGHDPTGGSTWHPLEPRLFRQIRLNGAGQPWRTCETRLSYLCDTPTTTGLTVTARVLDGLYQTGKNIADTVMKTRQVIPHAVCPHWPSTIRPRVEEALTT